MRARSNLDVTDALHCLPALDGPGPEDFLVLCIGLRALRTRSETTAPDSHRRHGSDLLTWLEPVRKTYQHSLRGGDLLDRPAEIPTPTSSVGVGGLDLERSAARIGCMNGDKGEPSLVPGLIAVRSEFRACWSDLWRRLSSITTASPGTDRRPSDTSASEPNRAVRMQNSRFGDDCRRSQRSDRCPRNSVTRHGIAGEQLPSHRCRIRYTASISNLLK